MEFSILFADDCCCSLSGVLFGFGVFVCFFKTFHKADVSECFSFSFTIDLNIGLAWMQGYMVWFVLFRYMLR